MCARVRVFWLSNAGFSVYRSIVQHIISVTRSHVVRFLSRPALMSPLPLHSNSNSHACLCFVLFCLPAACRRRAHHHHSLAPPFHCLGERVWRQSLRHELAAAHLVHRAAAKQVRHGGVSVVVCTVCCFRLCVFSSLFALIVDWLAPDTLAVVCLGSFCIILIIFF